MAATEAAPSNEENFRLSRIQAEGWAAAHQYGEIEMGSAKISSLNPYKADADRLRWFAGFHSALNRL